MISRIVKKLLAGCLSVFLTLQGGSVARVLALGDGAGVDLETLCENHLIHDPFCGYEQGSEAVEAIPVTECTMGLLHVDSVHTPECGYTAEIPGREAVPPRECTHSCFKCAVENPTILNSPGVTTFSTDVTEHLENLSFTVKQNGIAVEPGGRLNPTDSISVSVSFDVPDSTDDADKVKEGDTATFKVSSGLSMVNVADQPLIFSEETVGMLDIIYDPNAECTLGGKTVKGAGVAKVTFSKLVDDPGFSNISAGFKADMSYNGSGDAGAAGDHTVQILEKDYIVVVPEKETTIAVTKNGTADVGNKVIHWGVEVKAATEGGGIGSLKDCTFTDNLTAVGAYVGGTFKIGTTADESAALVPNPGAVYDPDSKILTYDFLEGDSGTQHIFFQTEIPQDNLEGNGSQNIPNTANVTTTREHVTTEPGSAIAQFDMKWIEKSGRSIVGKTGGVYDPTNQKIEWSITANHNDAKLNDAVIVDSLHSDFTAESASLQKWDASAGDWGAEVNITPTGNEYSLGSINTRVLLTITAKWNKGSLPTGVKNYKNTATLKWADNLTGYSVTSDDVGIGFAPISKTAAGYTPSTHEINWGVTVDAQSQNYGNSLRILDLLVYDESGFDVNGSYTIDNNSKGDLFDVTEGDLKQLTPQYNQKYVSGSFASTNALDIKVHTLSKGDQAVADLLVVTSADGTSGISNAGSNSFTYKSVVTNPTLYASNSEYSIKNTVAMFSESTRVSEAQATQKCYSRMIEKDLLSPEGGAILEINPSDVAAANSKGTGDKAFNYLNKAMYFRIHINANELIDGTNDLTTVAGAILGELTVRDTLPIGWEFQQIGGKNFLLFEGGKTGNVGFVKALKAVNESGYGSILTGGIPIPPTESVSSTIDFTFTALTKPYIIVVKAGPTSKTTADYFSKNQTNIPIRNNGALLAGSQTLAKDHEDATIKSQLMSKNLDDSKESEGYLKWSVEYKPYDLAHEEAYLEDTLPIGIDLRTNAKGELLMENNITATTLTLNSNGSYSEGSMLTEGELTKAVSYDAQTRVLRFKIPQTEKAYRFTYITDVTAETGTVKNTVSLKGSISAPVSAVDQKSYSITSTSSQASFNRSGWLLINKKDSGGDPLAGGKFTLYSEDGTTVIRSGTSGTNGKIYLKVLPEGSYILKESVAPKGYVLDGLQHRVTVSKDTAGKFITSIDGKTGASSNEIDVINHSTGTLGALKIEKTVGGNSGDTAKPFTFTLTLSDTANRYPYIGDGVPNGDIKSGEQISLAHKQSITIIGLPGGTAYRVTEEDYSSEGYTVTQTGDSGTIAVDSTETAAFKNVKNVSGGGGTQKPDSGSGAPGGGSGNPGGSGGNPGGSGTPGGMGGNSGAGSETPSGGNPNSGGVGDPNAGRTPFDYIVNPGNGDVNLGVGKPIADNENSDLESKNPVESSAGTPLESQPPTAPATYPAYPPENAPDPNSPHSPKKITVIEENTGTVGNYTKTQLSDGTFAYIDDNGIPLGSFRDRRVAPNPKTGNNVPIVPVLIFLSLSLCGTIVLGVRKKHRYSK